VAAQVITPLHPCPILFRAFLGIRVGTPTPLTPLLDPAPAANTFLRREIAKSGVRIRPAQGYPLGVVSDGRYENVSFTMAAGDRLTLYTMDCLRPAMPPESFFGFDRVRNLIATSPDADAASDAAVAFGQDDDITVLTVTA